ncbi:MAG: tRNA (guanosine(46)-N7)-methyltransferase TrmB, partial [Burkholderiaceae bacterium]|nr:tRNA (guanosine(46)-N7)-methyltransferase TrmB [Burkholderiaceae bacterium]
MNDTKQTLATGPAPEAPTAPKDRRRLPPAGVEFPKTIKSFVKRAGRTTTGQAKALEELGPRYVLAYTPTPLDRSAVFGADAADRPLILEIGFGMGDATAHIADLMREKNFLGCEVHEPGVGALLKHIG